MFIFIYIFKKFNNDKLFKNKKEVKFCRKQTYNNVIN